MYWKTGTKGERIRHLANCPHQTRRTRDEAKLERSKKASSETPSAQEDPPGPMEHFKGARETFRTRRRNTRPSRASASGKVKSYQEDTDDEAFEEMIATGEHAKYLADLKLEQEREERRKKRRELEEKQRKEAEESEEESPE